MRGRHCLLLIICALVLSLPAAWAGDPLRGLQKLFDDWGMFDGMQISGQNSLTFQGDSIEGSRSAYEGQRWDTGSLVRRSSLHVEGPVWRNLGVQMDISSSGWGNSYTRYVAGWTTNDTALYYGDLNIRLSGNEFASFNKTLKGWQVDQRLPYGGLLRGFYSEEKGLTRRQTINGNNTSGPYFLAYTPIVEGSEIVKVDEQVMRFGTDYRLDYETGQIYFEPVDAPPRIIPGTSVIQASYQSYGWDSGGSQLYGARAEVPLMDGRLRVGVTGVKQDKQEAGSTGSSVTYDGEQQTIAQPLVVLVDSAEQIEGVDYDSYRDIGRIIFRRAVPPTALVIIQYFYDLGQSELAGDQQVIGFDLGYRITDDLLLRSDYAQSSGTSAGSAWRNSIQYSQPRVNGILELRNVDPGFAYIDSVGFQRNEKGLNFSGQWQINDYISLSDRYSDLKSNSGLAFGYSGYNLYGTGVNTFGVSPAQTAAATSLEVQTTRNDVGIDVRYPDWPTLSLTRQTLENSGGSRGDSRQTTDDLRLNWTPYNQPITVAFNLTDTGQDYLGLVDAETGSAAPQGSSTQQMQTSLTYSPGRAISLRANYGHNTSDSTTDENTSTSDVTGLSLQWNPNNRLSVNVDHSLSESVGIVSSGFYGGGFGSYSNYGSYGGYNTFSAAWPQQTTPGVPYNPGGGSTGDGTGEDDEPSRYEDANTRLNISYRPADNMTLTLSGGQRKYTSGGGVGYLADSDQKYYNVTAGWQPNSELSVNATVGSDEMKFLEEGRGAVVNDMLALGVNYRPRSGPWGVALNLNSQTGSSPTYIGFGDQQISRTVPTDLLDISGQLTYELPSGARLYAQLGRAEYESGYANFKKDQGEFGVSYRYSDLADVSLSYRYIRNISWDPDLPLPGFSTATTASQNYIAHNFMLGVTSSFHSGVGSAGSSATNSGMRSFGGYQTGSSYNPYGSNSFGSNQYGTGSFGSNQYGSGSFGSNQYGSGSFGSNQYGTGSFGSGSFNSGGFSSGWTNTRGSSSQYFGSRRGGMQTGLGDFEQTQNDGMTGPNRPLPDGTQQPLPGMDQPPTPPGDPGEDTEDARRWWEWDE